MKDVRLSRRGALLGGAAAAVGLGAGAAAVQRDVLPGRVAIETRLGRGLVEAPVPAGPRADVRSALLPSDRMRQTVRWALATPTGVQPSGLPVVVALHGRGTNAHWAMDKLGVPAFLEQHVRAGGRPFAVASVDGGDATYWHPRRDGQDPLRLVSVDLVRALAATGLRTDGIGVLGWSMGGFGALLMAREATRQQLDGVRVAAAAAASPALFLAAGDTSPGAFDGDVDWRRWGDLVRDPGVGGVPLHVSCGHTDPFARPTSRYREHVRPTPAGAVSAGRHSEGYWRSLLPEQLAWFGKHLL